MAVSVLLAMNSTNICYAILCIHIPDFDKTNLPGFVRYNLSVISSIFRISTINITMATAELFWVSTRDGIRKNLKKFLRKCLILFGRFRQVLIYGKLDYFPR